MEITINGSQNRLPEKANGVNLLLIGTTIILLGLFIFFYFGMPMLIAEKGHAPSSPKNDVPEMVDEKS